MSCSGAEERLFKATQVFNKRSDISEVSNKINQEVGESLSKQQKEFFLRQQLQAITKELGRLKGNKSSGNISRQSSTDGKSNSSADLDDEQEDGEDLADLRKKIEAMRAGSEERKMASREWKRLKRIPAGSVENGVIRSYVCYYFVPPRGYQIFFLLTFT